MVLFMFCLNSFVKTLSSFACITYAKTQYVYFKKAFMIWAHKSEFEIALYLFIFIYFWVISYFWNIYVA